MPAKRIAEEAARLRAAPCERCLGSRPVEAHLVYLGDEIATLLHCKRCALDEQATAIFKGWPWDDDRAFHPAFSSPLDALSWLLPFNRTLRSTSNTCLNLWAMATRFAWGRPSSDLRRVAAERLAWAQLDAERREELAQMRRNTVDPLPGDDDNGSGTPPNSGRDMPARPVAGETIRRRRRRPLRSEH